MGLAAKGVGIVTVGLVLAGVGWGVACWRFQAILDTAGREMAAGRHAEAQRRLSALAAWWPGRAEVELPLGLCEQAQGHPDAALAAWGRVPAESPLAERAALLRGRMAMERGRFALAEEVLTRALRRPGPLATELRQVLVQLLWHEGRLAEVAPLIEANWRALGKSLGLEAPTTLATLRGHLSLDLEVYALDRIEEILDKAGRDAPDDDRVWLARANMAIRDGRTAEAADWLARCLAKRPEDPVVWESKLELALASDRPEPALEALGHLTPERLTAERALELRAWFAAHAGDTTGEQQALEALVAADRGRTAAIERLADLAIHAGQPDRAAELRRTKGELDRAKSRYANLVSSDLVANAPEMSRLAEALGRRFEAAAFLALVAKRHPQDPEAKARLTQLERALKGAPPPAPEPAALARELRAAWADRASPNATSATATAALPRFTDDAKAAGLVFTYDSGQSPAHQLPETMSGGVGLIDFDGDGWLDVYALQGGHFPPDSDHPHSGDRLFRNRRDGSFEDVTQRAGLASTLPSYGHGVAVGDFDNDGRPDLFVTRWRSYALYHNAGDGRFEDVTERAGLGGDRDWPTSAAFADFDGDGDLDLYVCHYLVWDELNPRLCPSAIGRDYTYCVPRLFEARPDHVFRNDGGRFKDVTEEAGIVDRDGRGLGVVAGDFDGDGRIDLFVANDGSANFLFRNLGNFRFEEVALPAGVAGNAEGGYQAGMGVASGDLDGDGIPDLIVTNFYGEGSTFFQGLGQGLFTDRSAHVGLMAASRYRLGFGVALIDADNDGRLDLATANGHVNDTRPFFPYAMPAQLLRGTAGARLVDVSAQSGEPWQVPRVGRGLAAGDLDNDGRIDLVLLAQNGPLAFFHNRTAGAGHFVSVHLEGTTSNRDAVGARVTLEAGGRRQVAQRLGGGSYESSNDPRLHFGLGNAPRIDRLEVRWPSGRTDIYRDLPADRACLLREGTNEAMEEKRKTLATEHTEDSERDEKDGKRGTTDDTDSTDKD